MTYWRFGDTGSSRQTSAESSELHIVTHCQVYVPNVLNYADSNRRRAVTQVVHLAIYKLLFDNRITSISIS